MYTNKLAASMV